MATTWPRSRVLFLVGLTIVAVLVVSCASGAKAPEGGSAPTPVASPAPATSTSPAPAPAPAATPTAALSASVAPAALSVADLFATQGVPGGPRIDIRDLERARGVQVLLKYHANKLPLWTKAKYGGEATFVASGAINLASALEPVKENTRRSHLYGALLYYEQGRCSWAGRDTDFSVCKGKYAENGAAAIMPGLIQRWEQPDPQTFVFHIRQGALWSAVAPMTRADREVTAEDVRWYLETMKKESILRDYFTDVRTLEVVSRFTLKLSMTAPVPDFIRNLTQTGVGMIPRECYEAKDCLGVKLVTAGPWLLREYVLRQKLVLDKNPEFFLKGLPYVDRWVWLSITDPAAQTAAYVSGQVVNYRSYSEAEALSVNGRVPGSVIHLQLAQVPMLLRPRLDGPLADVRVRRALMLAIDVPTLWQAASGGIGAIPMNTARDIIGLGKLFYFTQEQAGPWYQYDPERAKQLLAEAGYANGFKTTLTYSVTTATASFGDHALAVQSFWKRNLNVDLTLRQVDGTAFGAVRREKRWDGFIGGALSPGGWADGNSGFVELLKGGPLNYQDVDDPLINDLYARQLREVDPAKRAALLWQFEQRETDQLYSYRLNAFFPFDLMPASELNGASHMLNFWYTLGVSWVTMMDPDKAKR